MGLGKTFVGSEKMIQLDAKVNLIICQKSKISDWIDHFRQYYAEYQVLNLTNLGGMKAFLSWSHANMKIVGIINYELLWRRPQLIESLNEQPFTMMLDESSLIQNRTAKRSKFILKMQPKNVILLSGTPVGGKYENLWSQLHLLGWDISEAVYNTHYVNWKNIEVGGFTHKIVDEDNPYKNVDRLKSKLREHGAVFMKTEDCFQLPEQNIIVQNVPSSKEYKRFMKTCIITLDDTELIGDTSLTKLLRARQLCGQYSKEKLEAFEDILNSTNDRLIVFYNFNEELERLKDICSKFERPTSEVNGHVKDLTNFKECEDSICLCQYQSASKGLNLQEYGCNKIIYFTLPLSSEDFEQSKKRVHRIGQERPCFYYILLCKDSIEEDILQTLEMKRDFTDELFKGGKDAD